MKSNKPLIAYSALLGILALTAWGCSGDTKDSEPSGSSSSSSSSSGSSSSSSTGGPMEQTPKEACDALAGKMIGNATLSEPTLVAEANGVGEHCKVTGLIGKSLRFQVYLPTEWNQKLLYLGGGGWDGSIPEVTLRPSDASGGYVTVASNGGHDDPSGAVFLNNPEVQEDFGNLQIHKVLEAVKALVTDRYPKESLARSYFEGCSNGGREALIEATRWPEDFDGIVSRAPAYSFTKLCLAFNNNMKHQFGTPGGAINAAKAASISSAVLQECDGLDGVADGVVSDVTACAFDPASLLCVADDNDSCLTEEQIKTAQTIYGQFKLSNGTSIYPGWGPGGEGAPEGWPVWIIGIDGVLPVPAQMLFGESFVRYWIVKDPAYNSLKFEPTMYLSEIAKASATLDATPDLKAFFARKGKLILAHGTSDWAISYKGSIEYFNNIPAAVGGEAVRDANMEFFLQPGVQHCYGGAGADTVDLFSAVVSWVEEGKAPSTQNIVSTKLDMTGKVLFQRPLCEYPMYPRYNGTGDENAAASYTCTKP